MQQFFIGQFLIWLPKITAIIILLLAAIVLAKKELPLIKSLNLSFKKLIWLALAFQIAYVSLLTVLQYYVWSQNDFTKILLAQPNYFVFYVWGRFWLEMLWGFGAAGFLFALLWSLKYFRPEILTEQDLELVLLISLVVAWPNFVIFVPLLFLGVLVYLLFSIIFFRTNAVSMAWPAIIAGLITLIWGYQILDFFDLTILRI